MSLVNYINNEPVYLDIQSYTLSASPYRASTSPIFNLIHKELEVLLNTPDIRFIEVFTDYNLRISFLDVYTVNLYKGVLKIYDFDKDLSRIVKDKDLADKYTIVAETLLHSILNSDHPDEILYNLRKRVISHGLPLPIPDVNQRFFY